MLMRNFLSVLALSCMASVAVAQDKPEFVYDFVPTVENMAYQLGWDSEKGESVNEVRIEVKFDEDVWWLGGFSSQCYLLDKDGKKYDGWYPDFSGPSSDYTMLYLAVRGLDVYVDADYTLVIPQGLLGNTNWYYDVNGGRSNPELKYEFNEWKLAGCPRENKTVYDLDPISSSYSVEEVRINGQKTLELQLALEFSEAVAIYDNVKNKMSVWNAEGEYLQEAVLRTWVDENNPNKVIVGLRGVDIKTPNTYTINIWEGAIGTLEWAAEDYCESRSNPALSYEVSTATSAVEAIGTSGSDSKVFNLQGVCVDSDRLAKGIYIRNGKKVVVK